MMITMSYEYDDTKKKKQQKSIHPTVFLCKYFSCLNPFHLIQVKWRWDTQDLIYNMKACNVEEDPKDFLVL